MLSYPVPLKINIKIYTLAVDLQNCNERNVQELHKNYDKFTWLGVIFFPDETGLCNITRITVELWAGKKHKLKTP